MKNIIEYLNESLNFNKVYDAISIYVGDEELEAGKESNSIYDVIEDNDLWDSVAKELRCDVEELSEFVQTNDDRLSKKFKL